MDKKQFQSLLGMARIFQRVDPDRADFWRGFQRGLRRLHHQEVKIWENFGTVEEHMKFLNCRNGEFRRDFQFGYRAGFYREEIRLESEADIQPLRKLLGLSVADLAEIAAVSPRTVEGWEQGRPMAESARQLIKKYLII